MGQDLAAAAEDEGGLRPQPVQHAQQLRPHLLLRRRFRAAAGLGAQQVTQVLGLSWGEPEDLGDSG